VHSGIDATADGRKELIAVVDGFRESEQSWKALLLDVKSRGLVVDPKLATGDGALGFWKALRQVYPATREQRCWVHKTANVLDKLPKRLQPQAKRSCIKSGCRDQSRRRAGVRVVRGQLPAGTLH
jgi:transposase-like protein